MEFIKREKKKKATSKKKPFFRAERSVAITKELGIYVETDILHKSMTIGKGRKKIVITIMQAQMLQKMLNHQIQLLSDT